MNMAKQDRLLLAMVISVLYILVFQNHSTNAIQEEMIIGRQCILEAIDLYNKFPTKICDNFTNADPMQWLPKQCLHICKPLRLSNCSSKGNTNILIQLNLSTATGNIYFPISEYESGKCSDCHYIESIAINCNIDSLFDIKDCSGLLNTASTRPTTLTNVSTDTTKTTTQTASQEYLPTCKPCPLTSTVKTITTKELSTFKDTPTTSASAKDIERICHNNKTLPISSSQGKQNDVSIHYLAASGIGGIIIGAVLALLFVFLLQKRTARLRSRLAEEHSMENPAYNKDHRFSDQFYNTQSSQNEVYSEIQANSYSRKSHNNNSAKTTQRLKSKDKESDYDHLNDAFETDTNDQIMYDHAQYISKTHSEQQVDKENGDYTQTNPMNVDRSYVEVTGEGSEGFVLDIQKQQGNVTNGQYFVLKKETN